MIFRINFKKFFENVGPGGNKNYAGSGNPQDEVKHVSKTLRRMNGFLTEVLDPNLYFSRLSFLESGKQAIDIKYEQGKGKTVGQHEKLPKLT